MSHTSIGIVGVIVMIALIVGLDIAFLQARFVLRLIVNVCIVLAFGAAYLTHRHHL